MKYKVIDNEVGDALVYDGFLKIKKTLVEIETFIDGNFKGELIQKTFEVMERGNAVAVLIRDTDTNTFLFTNQFRYPTIKENSGWLLEIPAGGVKENENPEECAKREVEEELGYLINDLKMISKFYVSPGGTTEMIFLYYAEVNSINKTSKGGGLKYEKEDIKMTTISVNEVMSKVGSELIDAKTIIAIQWWFLQASKL